MKQHTGDFCLEAIAHSDVCFAATLRSRRLLCSSLTVVLLGFCPGVRMSTLLEGAHVLRSQWREDGIRLRPLLRCNVEEVRARCPSMLYQHVIVRVTEWWCFYSSPLPSRLLHSCHDDSSRFISLLAKPSCNYLEQEDFIPLLQVNASPSAVLECKLITLKDFWLETILWYCLQKQASVVISLGCF